MIDEGALWLEFALATERKVNNYFRVRGRVETLSFDGSSERSIRSAWAIATSRARPPNIVILRPVDIDGPWSSCEMVGR